MRYKYTVDEYKRIEELVICALSAQTKTEAKKYSEQINYVTFDVTGYSKNVLSEVIASTVAASGSIRNKAEMVSIARQYLVKFEMFCVE